MDFPTPLSPISTNFNEWSVEYLSKFFFIQGGFDIADKLDARFTVINWNASLILVKSLADVSIYDMPNESANSYQKQLI